MYTQLATNMAKTVLPGSKKLENPKWELFCWLYAGYHNRDLFGNGTRCYAQAYGYNDEITKNEIEVNELMSTRRKGYSVRVAQLEARNKSLMNTARNEASALLAKPSVRARVDNLLDQYIDENHTDRELQYVIMQRHDLNSKVQAVKEFNRLKDRGAAGRLEGTFTFAWEGDDDEQPKQKKRPIIKKATLKSQGAVEWEGDKE